MPYVRFSDLQKELTNTATDETPLLHSQSGPKMRSEVIELGRLGPLPSYKAALVNPNGEALVNKYADLIASIKPPVTDAEARVLVGIFGCRIMWS